MYCSNVEFPTYKSPEIAAKWGCMHCHLMLDHQTLVEDDYPAGRGKYRMTCNRCDMSTWFDLEPK